MKMVTDHFSSVLTRNVPGTSDPRSHGLPWGPEQQRVSSLITRSSQILTIFQQVVAIQTVMDFRMLQMQWVLPEQDSNYESKPTSILSHFIGHEGPGSLHSYFKQKGWMTDLWAGFAPNARGFGFFNVTLTLTKTGLGVLPICHVHSTFMIDWAPRKLENIG
jgi:secreted Zn-dependent insulinase-like peptidase